MISDGGSLDFEAEACQVPPPPAHRLSDSASGRQGAFFRVSLGNSL